MKQLKYIPRIKGTKYTEADIVCAIALALFILWKNLVSKIKKIPESIEHERRRKGR